jgi:hypothetical protein
MIDQVLDFICAKVNNYLRIKLKLHSSDDDPIVPYNISQLSETTPNTSGDKTDPHSTFISLINIVEDRMSKSQENFTRDNKGIVTYANPKIFLNLYILFSANRLIYSESLMWLSYIIQFFQYQNVFTPLTSPKMPEGVDELILDLVSLSYQDLNNLWGILGSRYLPSVMYKMRMITIYEDFEYGGAGLIQKITINDKTVEQ